MKMNPDVSIHLYSKFKPQKINLGSFNIYLNGMPILMGEKVLGYDWIRKIYDEFEHPHFKSDSALKLKEILENTTGSFSLIFRDGDDYIIASDVIRSYPLFYGVYKNKVFITDNLEEFQKENGSFKVDYKKLIEFCSSGSVFNKGTVYKDVYSIQAGEIVTIRNNNIISDRYFELKPKESVRYRNLPELDYIKEFDSILILIFSRLIENHPDVNRWIIPLSGGHDSRLVVNYLYRLGIKNVICFSYGTRNNEQSVISKKVAEALGYEWHFVEYTDTKWKVLHTSGVFTDYLSYSWNGVSTPHLQDFLAVYELKEKRILREGDIFIPGHTVVPEDAFNANTQKLETREEALEYVFSKNVLTNKILKDRSSVFTELQYMYDNSKTTPKNFMGYCDWQERQAKFISNSIKVYEFFGYKTLQPTWDREWIDIWMKIPAEKRVNRSLQFLMEERRGLVSQLMNIPYANDDHKESKFSLKSILKRGLPNYAIVLLLRLTRRGVVLNEGMNLVYAVGDVTVKNLLDPIEDFPDQVLSYYKDIMLRYTYQVDSNVLTVLYIVRRLLDGKRN